MKRSDFRFFHRLRVRWSEVDRQDIVYNAHYLMYFDTAMADYWRAVAVPYDEAMRLLDGDFYVKKATIEFHSSARMADSLDVAFRCDRFGKSSMLFTGAIFRDDALLISCEMLYVFADPAVHRSKTIPAALRELLQAYEAGEKMLNVRIGPWQELGEIARRVRTDANAPEEGSTTRLECAEEDGVCLHAVAFNKLGQAVAAGRLRSLGQGVSEISWVEVKKVLRGAGVGRELMAAAIGAAIERGDHEVVLRTNRKAEAFFCSLGFVHGGKRGDEAGVPHVEMVRSLTAG